MRVLLPVVRRLDAVSRGLVGRVYGFLTTSVPLTGIPHTVPAYRILMPPPVSSVAFPLGNENGQLVPPWPTSPCAFHSSVEPLTVPVPFPVTWIVPAHV